MTKMLQLSVLYGHGATPTASANSPHHWNLILVINRIMRDLKPLVVFPDFLCRPIQNGMALPVPPLYGVEVLAVFECRHSPQTTFILSQPSEIEITSELPQGSHRGLLLELPAALRRSPLQLPTSIPGENRETSLVNDIPKRCRWAGFNDLQSPLFADPPDKVVSVGIFYASVVPDNLYFRRVLSHEVKDDHTVFAERASDHRILVLAECPLHQRVCLQDLLIQAVGKVGRHGISLTWVLRTL